MPEFASDSRLPDFHATFVGARLLAMVVNDGAFIPGKDAAPASPSSERRPQQAGSYRGLSRASGKMPGRLCLAEGLCHDDLTAG
jgi:hypothetical protein